LGENTQSQARGPICIKCGGEKEWISLSEDLKYLGCPVCYKASCDEETNKEPSDGRPKQKNINKTFA